MSNKTKHEILKMIYALQIPDKALMRSVGYSYDWTGRIINELLEDKCVKSVEIDRIPRAISLTNKGYGMLQEKIAINDGVRKKLKERVKGDNNKLRQYRIATTVQMLNSYIPEYIDDFLLYEKRIDDHLDTIDGVLNRQSKIEKYRAEFERRRKLDKQGRFFITVREMRELDEDNLKNIQSPRALGFLHLEGGNFVVYNSLKNRIRTYGEFDMLYKELIEEITDNSLQGSITFATTNKVFIDSINSNINEKQFFTLSNRLFKKAYYVVLDSNGCQQLYVYTKPDFRKQVAIGLFESEDIKRAENTIYDAIDSFSNISYLGFECDYNEVETLKMNAETIHLNRGLSIYCFPHQVKLYSAIFGDRATILQVEIEAVKRFFGD